ncbi:MAG: hypothetical protein AAF481_01285 [Acidobacteriota bacterium]
MKRPIDPAHLLPHRAPARLVEKILEHGPDRVVCRGSIPPTSPFVANGRAPSFLGLELAAQGAVVLTAGIGDGDAGDDSAPAIGYLVRMRGAALSPEGVPAGAPLIAKIERTGGAGRLGIFSVRVTDGDRTVAEGSLSTVRVDD